MVCLAINGYELPPCKRGVSVVVTTVVDSGRDANGAVVGQRVGRDQCWKVRIKNKSFWIALIPAVLLLVQVTAAVFGYILNLGELGDKLLAVMNALFAVLAILGIVTDPTAAGIGDSRQALTYQTPKKEDAT